jgi:hypothetical protein
MEVHFHSKVSLLIFPNKHLELIKKYKFSSIKSNNVMVSFSAKFAHQRRKNSSHWKYYYLSLKFIIQSLDLFHILLTHFNGQKSRETYPGAKFSSMGLRMSGPRPPPSITIRKIECPSGSPIIRRLQRYETT